MTAYTWLAAFIALNILDAALTVYAIRLGASEANPLIRLLMRRMPLVPALAIPKVAIIAMFIATLDSIAFALPFLVCVYIGICGWNAWQIVRLQRAMPG